MGVVKLALVSLVLIAAVSAAVNPYYDDFVQTKYKDSYAISYNPYRSTSDDVAYRAGYDDGYNDGWNDGKDGRCKKNCDTYYPYDYEARYGIVGSNYAGINTAYYHQNPHISTANSPYYYDSQYYAPQIYANARYVNSYRSFTNDPYYSDWDFLDSHSTYRDYYEYYGYFDDYLGYLRRKY